MYTLSSNSFVIKVDEKDGCIKSLIGVLQNGLKTEFCDARPLKRDCPLFWGEVIVGDEIISRPVSLGKVSFKIEDNVAEALYEHNDFSVRVTRVIYDDHMDETYELVGKCSFTLTNLGFVFRPHIGMLVAEHEGFKLVDWNPVIFHWFTGNNLAYLCITRSNGAPPHLGIVLIDGRINGFSTPYTYQEWENDPLPLVPILHVTAHAMHKQDDEYPQPVIAMRPTRTMKNIYSLYIEDAGPGDVAPQFLQPRDVEKVTFRYFLFSSWEDFEQKVVKLCGQPVFDYPRFLPKGARLKITVTLPDSVKDIEATLDGENLNKERLDKNKYRFSIIVSKSGLQKVYFKYGSKSTFILFEGMDDLRDLIQARTDYILSKQLCLDPNDPKYGGIFAIDNLTEKLIYSSTLGTCQLAGTGEILYSAALVLLKNLVDPKPEEVRKIEITACEWIRKKCMDANFACYLNPLNRLIFKDSKWTYSKEKIDQYVNPANPKEMGWRRWNGIFIGPILYLLSLFDDKVLEREKSDTYLLWAYGVLNWYYSTEPSFGAALSDYVLKTITRLEERGYHKEAKRLKDAYTAFVERIRLEARMIDGKDFVRDELGVDAAILLLEKDLASALPLLRINDTGLGYSYDPRVQSAFRFWDDGASGGYYQLVPYLTMPHFWTGFAGYSCLLAYELTKKEGYLKIAYNSIMTFYESYNYDYRWNKWGKMRKGQAHVNYLPSLDTSTQERHCVDQDMGIIPYLETFGKRCYVTKNGTYINCQKDGNKITSWAMYPREYLIDNEELEVRVRHFSVMINWVEKKGGDLSMEIENLSHLPISTNIEIFIRNVKKIQQIELEGKEKRTITLSL